MAYHPKVNGVNSTSLSGGRLAHNHASPVIRAFWAADLVLGVRQPHRADTDSGRGAGAGQPLLCVLGGQAPSRARGHRAGTPSADSRSQDERHDAHAGAGN